MTPETINILGMQCIILHELHYPYTPQDEFAKNINKTSDTREQ